MPRSIDDILSNDAKGLTIEDAMEDVRKTGKHVKVKDAESGIDVEVARFVELTVEEIRLICKGHKGENIDHLLQSVIKFPDAQVVNIRYGDIDALRGTKSASKTTNT